VAPPAKAALTAAPRPVASRARPAAEDARAERPLKPGKTYVGPDGITLAMLPLAPEGEHKVLLRVGGSGSLFDGKVMAHTVEQQSDGDVNYVTVFRGRRWITIAVRFGSYSLYVPGRRDSPVVKYDEERSKALNINEIWKSYQRQRADGTLAKLAEKP